MVKVLSVSEVESQRKASCSRKSSPEKSNQWPTVMTKQLSSSAGHLLSPSISLRGLSRLPSHDWPLRMAESSPFSMPIKLESISPKAEHEEIAEEEEQCTICLQPIVDRTLVPTCSHEFCFECLMVWSGKCPFSPRVMCLPPIFLL